MTPLGNDRWTGEVVLETLGRHEFAIEGWVDRFASWRRGLARKVEAGQDVTSELLEGAALVGRAAERAAVPMGRGSRSTPRRSLDAATGVTRDRAPRRSHPSSARAWPAIPTARASGDAAASACCACRSMRERRGFGAWYEMFPRSAVARCRRGTARCATSSTACRTSRRMGFDVLYLPPIHPIGTHLPQGPRTTRSTAGAGDPGSPWAIGAAEGGHTAVHPELGTLADFDRLVGARRRARASSSRSTSPSSARPTIRG